MKKIMAGMLATCIAFSPIVSPVFANEADDVMRISSKEEDEATSMKRVLLIVKEKINIPEELTEFSYRINYSSGKYAKNKYWNFEWRDKEYKNNITVRADEAGNILSYSIYNSDKETLKPTYLKEELVKNATDFIKQVAPEISDNIVLESSSFSGVYSGTYLYTFERIENGVRMPDNKVTVSVNYETGEVRSFNATWTFDIKIPSAEANITIEDAREKIGKEVNMNLKYMNKTEEVDGKRVVKAFLVYVPDKSYMAVDAKTGEIYDTKNEFFDMSEYSNSDMKEMLTDNADMALDGGGLTEEEINKINEVKNLITKEDAISAVTSKSDVLLIDDASKAVSARLTQKYDYSEKKYTGYVWNLTFSDPRAIDYNSDDRYRSNTNVTVDAESGKILSFYSSVRNYYDSKSKEWEDVKVKYSSKECQDTFEKFVKSLEAEKFSNTKLSNSSDSAYLLKYINEKPVYGGYSYNYSRVNEGIEYSYNNISGKVDGVTGKIYSYNVNWTDNIEFESPKNAMSAKDAYKAYSEKEGFEFVYEVYNKHYIENNPDKEEKYYDYSDLYILEHEARLVYRTNIYPQYISPFTGEQLDYFGEVYEDVNEKEYTDIDGFWGERSIKLITDMGYTFSGDKFLPDQAITKEEWFKLLEIVRYYVSEKEYEDLDSLTNLDAVKIIIKNLGLEKVAKLSDIYKSSFNDINKINHEDIGYVALAEGLGLVSGDSSNNFNPDNKLTRIEAVCMALKLANVK